MTLEESRSLLHEGEMAPSGFHDLTDQLEGRPAALLPGASGDSLVIATDTDKLLYFSYDEDGETWVKPNHSVPPGKRRKNDLRQLALRRHVPGDRRRQGKP